MQQLFQSKSNHSINTTQETYTRNIENIIYEAIRISQWENLRSSKKWTQLKTYSLHHMMGQLYVSYNGRQCCRPAIIRWPGAEHYPPAIYVYIYMWNSRTLGTLPYMMTNVSHHMIIPLINKGTTICII